MDKQTDWKNKDCGGCIYIRGGSCYLGPPQWLDASFLGW